MKRLLLILLLALLFLAVGCSTKNLQEGVQRGMYQGLVEKQRLQEFPDNAADNPPSYDQYQDQRKQRPNQE